MPLYQSVVLGIVQGITEFLPVSSTAHLTLIPWLLGWKDPGLTFDVALHAGTLVAVILYFWRMWLELIAAAFGFGDPANPETPLRRKLFWLLVIGTIPAAIAGWLFESAADRELRSPIIIGIALIVVAIFMGIGDRLKGHGETLWGITMGDAWVVGIAQAFAVIPGVSRSGSTMTAGLFRDMNRDTAARYSFLLSTPIIAGAALKKGMEIRHAGLAPDMRLPFIVGIVASGIVGFAVIAWLIRYLERRTFTVFVVYRIALGVLILALGWGFRYHLGYR